MSGRNPQPRHTPRARAGRMDKWLRTFKLEPMNLWAPGKRTPRSDLKRIPPKAPEDWPTVTRKATAEEIREAAKRGA